MAQTKQSITVAIVTRNRATDLYECLASLSKQTTIPTRVVIIDNNSTDETSKVIQKFSKILKITAVLEKTIGYPHVYNRALKEVATTWVAFIDDDCIADKNWYKEITVAIKSNAQCAAILGESRNYFPTNPIACAFQFSNDLWRRECIRGSVINNYSVLDSRNIVYNRELLMKHAIQFDASFIYGGEDSDLGMQIQQQKRKAIFAKNVIVCHKEPLGVLGFFRKKLSYAISEQTLMNKWSVQIDKHKRPTKIQKKNILTQVCVQLSIFQKFICQCIMIVDKILSKLHIYTFIGPFPQLK